MSIVVEGLSKFYGKQKALDGLSFAIDGPEVVGFLGPNGAGKSTLMKILTTTLGASGGDAYVNGYHVATQKRAVQKSIGYLPENNALYSEMYVCEYLAFNARFYGVGKKRIEELVTLTGLYPEVHKKIYQLSKGYRQRVGLANALLHDPEVLLIDEPTTGLDPNQLIAIRDLIATLGTTKTVLLSTHIMQECEAMCSRIIIIDKGCMVADKTLKALRETTCQSIVVEFDYRVEEAFLKRLPMVESTVNVDGFTYEIYFSTSKDMRSCVFDFARDNQLKILQLYQKNPGLETFFRALTQS